MFAVDKDVWNSFLASHRQQFVLDLSSQIAHLVKFKSTIFYSFEAKSLFQLDAKRASGFGKYHDAIFLDPFGYDCLGIFILADDWSHG